MVGSPKRRERRERAVALYESAAFWDELFTAIGSGGYAKHVCEKHDIPFTSTLEHLKRDPALAARYEAARELRAAYHVQQIEEATQRLLDPDVDPDKAKAINDGIKSLQWLAAKRDPKQFGERQQIDVQHTHTGKLHLDAIRALSERKAAERLAATDAEVVSEVRLRPAALPASDLSTDD